MTTTPARDTRPDPHPLKAALTGRNVVPPGGEAEAISTRLALWTPELRPVGAYQIWLVGEIVAHSVRIELCQKQEAAIREHEANRALLSWDADRRTEAEEVGAKLAKAPSRIARVLAQTSQGCDWLIRRWEALARVLEAGGTWDDPQRRLALDLLGTPKELRDAPSPITAQCEDSDAARLALARAEVARLEARKADALDELEARERSFAEVGFRPNFSRAMLQVRRHEAASVRRMNWAHAELRKAQRQGSPAAAPAPVVEDSDLAFEFEDMPEPPASIVNLPPLSQPFPTSPAPVGNRRARRYQRKMGRGA